MEANLELKNEQESNLTPSYSLELGLSNANNTQKNKKMSFDNKRKSNKKPEAKELHLELTYDGYEPTYQYKQFKKKTHKEYFIVLNHRSYNFEPLDILEQSRFKFILNPLESSKSAVYTKYYSHPHSTINWEDVSEVIYYAVDEHGCPICQEKELVAPMITRCGHIFCYPCIVNYNDYMREFSINKQEPKCPLCKEILNVSLLRRCSVKECRSYLDQETIKFNLIMKERKGSLLYDCSMDPDLSVFKQKYLKKKEIPIETEKEFRFSKLNRTTNKILLEKLSNYLDQLNFALEEEKGFYNDEKRINSINKCINLISANIEKTNNKIQKEENSKVIEITENLNENVSTLDDEKESHLTLDEEIDFSKYVFFYQESQGDIYYLYPLNYSILITEYNTIDHLPPELKGRILEIEMMTMNPKLKNLYPFLHHVQIGAMLFFVEIDMRNLVSNYTLKSYQNQLKERHKTRQNIKKEEESYNSFVQKVKRKEEEKIIQFYEKHRGFVILRDDSFKEKEENNEEEQKKEEDEETKEQTKKENKLSILFNLKEEEEIVKKVEENPVPKFSWEENDFPTFEDQNKKEKSKNAFKTKKNTKNKKFIEIDFNTLKNKNP